MFNKSIGSSREGKLILIIGPSGSGKGVVIRSLKKNYSSYIFPISCTTRLPRPGERDGEVYHFISRDDFLKRIERGDFLEWAIVHHDHYYGTLKEPILDALSGGKILVREVDVQGMNSILKILPKDQVVTIFLTTPSWEILQARILHRHKETEHELIQRKISFEKELEESKKCDYIVHSLEGQIPKMVSEIEKIIQKETS